MLTFLLIQRERQIIMTEGGCGFLCDAEAFTHPSGCSTWCWYVLFEWDAINVTYKGRICLRSLVGPPAAAFGRRLFESGSQGRWLHLHVLINLEVTAQRGRSWLRSAVAGLPESNELYGINVFLCQLLQENSL